MCCRGGGTIIFREELFVHVYNNVLFVNLDDTKKLFFTADNNTCKIIGKCIHLFFKKRKDIMDT